MKITSILLIFAGGLTLLADLIYVVYGIENKICVNDPICIPAMLIIGGMILGITFILIGIDEEEKA